MRHITYHNVLVGTEVIALESTKYHTRGETYTIRTRTYEGVSVSIDGQDEQCQLLRFMFREIKNFVPAYELTEEDIFALKLGVEL